MSRTCCSHSHTWNFVQKWGWDSHQDHSGLEYPDITIGPVDTWDFPEAFSMSYETNGWTDFVPRKRHIIAGWHRKGRLTIRVGRGRPPDGGQLVVQGGERSCIHTVSVLSAIAWPRVKGQERCDWLYGWFQKAKINMNGFTQPIKHLTSILSTINIIWNI